MLQNVELLVTFYHIEVNVVLDIFENNLDVYSMDREKWPNAVPSNRKFFSIDFHWIQNQILYSLM